MTTPTSPPTATRAETVFPVALRLADRVVLVVGAGPVGAHKAETLLAAGARVRLVAPDVGAEAEDLAVSAEHLDLRRRAFDESDLEGVCLVITATGRVEVDSEVARLAEARGLWVNSADDRERCSFFLPAVVRREPVVVAVSTSGASPALAAWLRRWIDERLPAGLGELAALLESARRRGEAPAGGWIAAVDEELVALAAAGRLKEVRERLGRGARS